MKKEMGEDMAKIIYTYKNQVYANITNKCDCACTFCIRKEKDGIGEADNLWHKKNPSIDEVLQAIDEFDFTGYKELVFCGYGEPTCELDILLAAAAKVKDKGIQTRLNTNGLGSLYNERNIVPELAKVIDSISISLNAPDKETYDKVTRPQFKDVDAFQELIEFAKEAAKVIPDIKLSVVDVLSEDEIERSQKLADEIGIYLRVRKFGE